MADIIKVHFSYQEASRDVCLDLPSDTLFDDLTPMLYKNDYLIPQKPGFYYIVKNHLCGARQRLSDYIPDGVDTLDVQVFGMPQIMV